VPQRRDRGAAVGRVEVTPEGCRLVGGGDRFLGATTCHLHAAQADEQIGAIGRHGRVQLPEQRLGLGQGVESI
jgi:hypothetical protein